MLKLINAELLKLEGKYYGSVLRINYEYNSRKEFFEIKVWINNSDLRPSKREDSEGENLCDSHYETKECYEFCQAIFEAIKNKE